MRALASLSLSVTATHRGRPLAQAVSGPCACGARSHGRGQGPSLPTELLPRTGSVRGVASGPLMSEPLGVSKPQIPGPPPGPGGWEPLGAAGPRICVATAPLPLRSGPRELGRDQPHMHLKQGPGHGRRGAVVVPSERGSVHFRDASVSTGLRGSPRPAAPDPEGCKAPFESYGSVTQRNARSDSPWANHSHRPV